MTRCSNCAYWSAFSNGYGSCRRYPPQVICLSKEDVNEGVVDERWPTVHGGCWCGEFKMADAAKRDREDKP